jgi:Fanconi-associated nuclease 1
LLTDRLQPYSVWHADKKVCRFVEVKSPNDTLSETQKVWISVLLSAGIDVEVCHVAEDNDTAPLKAAKKRKLNNGKRSWGGQERYDYNGTHDADEDEDEDEDEDDDDEFKYESGGEGKGEGRLLSRAESEAVRKQRRENSENIEPDGNADMKPSFRGARNGSVPARTSLRKMGSGCEVVVLGDSAAQPIEIL